MATSASSASHACIVHGGPTELGPSQTSAPAAGHMPLQPTERTATDAGASVCAAARSSPAPRRQHRPPAHTLTTCSSSARAMAQRGGGPERVRAGDSRTMTVPLSLKWTAGPANLAAEYSFSPFKVVPLSKMHEIGPLHGT